MTCTISWVYSDYLMLPGQPLPLISSHSFVQSQVTPFALLYAKECPASLETRTLCNSFQEVHVRLK
jgi:hypothetical protein